MNSDNSLNEPVVVENLTEITRKIFAKQHRRNIKDDIANARLKEMGSETFYNLGDDFFKDKIALDAGCGNTAHLCIQLCKFGVRKVCGFDIGTEWITDAENELKKAGFTNNNFELLPGNILNIPYQDETFDFVASEGVMCHLADIFEFKQAFSELTRVLRRGGVLYISVGIGKNSGLLEGIVFPAIREYYKTNEDFKAFVDNISSNDFECIAQKAIKDMKHFANQEVIYNKALFDEDLCLTIQDIIQAPSRINTQYSIEDVENLFQVHGFQKIRRLNRYVLRNNIRKYLAPFHYDKTHPFSKLLYGDGYIEYLGFRN